MNNNLNIASRLLHDFKSCVDNRSIVFLAVLQEVFPKILNWHFKTWEKEFKYLEDRNQRDEWGAYYEIEVALDSILRKIEERSLTENQSFPFFEHFGEHVENHKRKSVRQHFYGETLMSTFYSVFFQIMDKIPERHDVWAHFPEKWKVSTSNFKDKENIISRYSLHEYLQWAIRRIMSEREKTFDSNLENVTSNLFPEVNPIIWAKCLIFYFSAFEPHQATEIPWSFGLIGRSREAVGAASDEDFEKKLRERDEKEDRIESDKTFELAVFLFREDYSEKKLVEYLEKLENLQYPKDSQQERKRSSLIFLFDKMLEYVRRRKQNGPK